MKVPIEWLKEYVTVRLKPAALAERLTMAGVEVTGIETVDGEPVLDLEVTPNRADCLSVIGVAREVAAIARERLKDPRRSRGASHKSQGGRAARVKILIEDRKGCARYIGRLLEGVRVAPSPAWMQRRLIACGVRPINNIVDITNYVLLEYGQPLHAFDYHRLAEATICVRRAEAKEPITTLDGTARTLDPKVLVIADARQAVAVAGVMGGLGSEVTERTSTVLLESALFDPITVRRTARRLGLVSESSYRFERGVDPEGVDRASARAAELMEELGGGTVRAVKDVGQKPSTRTTILLEPVRLNRWLGTSLLPANIRTALARLSCRIASSGDGPTMRVSAPSFRRDLAQPVDLYEEVARVVGYNSIRAALPVVPMAGLRMDASSGYGWRQSLRSLCASLGLTEALNWSLVSEGELSRYSCPVDRAVRLANPLSQDHAYLRPSLLIGLMNTVRRNLTQGASSVRVFELGTVVQQSGGVHESQRLGIALSGWWIQDWRVKEACDFFYLKGLLEALIVRLCGAAPVMERSRESWAEPYQTTAVLLNGRRIGLAGQVSATIREAMDLEQEVWFAELSVEDLLRFRREGETVRAPVVFPPVKRDLSVLVSNEIDFVSIVNAIREMAGALASRVELIDRYTGTQTPAGFHSLTFSVEYRDPSRTLTAKEAQEMHQRIGQTLVRQFGATLR